MRSTPSSDARSHLSSRLVSMPRPKQTVTPDLQHNTNLLMVVSIAGFIAFYVATVITGVMAAGIYCWQTSGAFAP